MPIFRVVMMAAAKTLSKLFGMATVTFFGRQPSRDDEKVALMGVLSVTWLFVAVSAPFPDLAEMMIPLLPDDETVVQATAIALTVGIPPLVGWLVTRLHNRGDRGLAVAREMLFGYGYALILSGLVIALVVAVPAIKGSYLLRRFELKHIAIMIKKGTYDDVLAQICDALRRHGIEPERQDPHKVIWALFASFVWIEGHIFRREMSKQMQILRGEVEEGGWFEVTVHATDISVVGQRRETSLVMAILAEELDERHVYFSWDDAAQELEDRIRDCQERIAAGEPVKAGEIAALCRDLRHMELETEEWNSIRRQIYRLERDYYRHKLPEQEKDLVT